MIENHHGASPLAIWDVIRGMTTHPPCDSHALNEILFSIVVFGKYLYFWG
jgi:hypothetical protein